MLAGIFVLAIVLAGIFYACSQIVKLDLFIAKLMAFWKLLSLLQLCNKDNLAIRN